MTKEELKQEAEEKYFNHKMMEFQGFYNRHYYYLGYLDSAEPREKRIAELEKEIAELDCQKNRNKACYSCANATERCFKNEIGCPCEKYKSYKDENAELKSKNCWKTCEYAEPKSQLISQHIQDVAQLSKAKEIIKKLVHEFYYLCELYNFATDYECLAEAEQFLNSEVEK